LHSENAICIEEIARRIVAGEINKNIQTRNDDEDKSLRKKKRKTWTGWKRVKEGREGGS